jgi:aminoglycoside phosphotransferase (APT) family kinase protein
VPFEQFKQEVGADLIAAMCRRAFGAGVRVGAVSELGLGSYNTTYRVDVDGTPVILRVAPEPARQYRSERELMRNEHLSQPYLAPVASLLPRTLAADFTHQLVGRDYLFQSLLPGLPGPEGLPRYPPDRRAPYFRQLGAITRAIHDVRGPGFGPVNGPPHPRWSDALIDAFGTAADDIERQGLAAGDVRELAALADRDRDLLDEITEPRLLHGDLWTVNVMMEPAAPEPTITGILDCDRTWWGDPAADWTIHMVARKPDRTPFWDTYGHPDRTPDAARRQLYYRARHTYAIRLERHRLHGDVPDTYPMMAELLDLLR